MKMSNSVSMKLMYFISIIILETAATTHWVLIGNGKIQTENVTHYPAGGPHHLLAFLEQMKSNERAISIQQEILSKLTVLDKQAKTIHFLLENVKLLNTSDGDCPVAGDLLDNTIFYDIPVFDGRFRGLDQNDYVLSLPSPGKLIVPNCEKTFPLDFSMYTYDHFEAMQDRKNLVMPPEVHLLKYLPPDTEIKQFGNQVARHLHSNSTSWVYLNLAAIYWRMRGNAYKALECSRRAIVSAPGKYRDMPLLTTGGILHAARHSQEAAIILHIAQQLYPVHVCHHLALGHVYSTLGHYDQALLRYDSCLESIDSWEVALQAKQRVICLLKLGNLLNALQGELVDVIPEFVTIKHRIDELTSLHDRIMRQQSMHLNNRRFQENINQKLDTLLKHTEPSGRKKVPEKK